jgi:NAD+ kinase
MLEAMRVAARADATAIGVNLGRIGFLTDISVQEHLTHAIAAAILRLTDTFIEERLLLEPSFGNMLAINEVSISQLYADAMITYRLIIGDVDAGVHRANGLLISTPTGSTAYSLSVGGALMLPEMDAIQIVPVAPSTMTSRPIIVPSTTSIQLQVWGGAVTVRADGQILDTAPVSKDSTPSKSDPYKLTVKPYARKAKVLHFSGWNFFDVLTEKLGWKHE